MFEAKYRGVRLRTDGAHVLRDNSACALFVHEDPSHATRHFPAKPKLAFRVAIKEVPSPWRNIPMLTIHEKFLTVALCGFLTSCGGGGGGGGGGGDGGGSGGASISAAVPADTVRLSCRVTDKANGSVVSGAEVNYQAGTKEFVTTTSSDGRCELNLPASEVAGVAYPAASARKIGYEPQTFLFLKLEGGKNYSQDVALVPLLTSVSIPVGGEVVMHLGDDVSNGLVNSQFQKQSDGPELTFAIADWAAQVKAGFKKATVYLDAKGWQTAICANTIALVGDTGTVALPGGNSPSDGSWGGGKQVPFVFAVADVGALRADLRITAGVCGSTTDLDDFEINRVRVYFE